jgi:hypothetical protein
MDCRVKPGNDAVKRARFNSTGISYMFRHPELPTGAAGPLRMKPINM